MEQFSSIPLAGMVLNLIWMLDNFGVSGYNIETKKIGLETGAPGSQFGYAVAFANAPGWVDSYKRDEKIDKVLLVGAPNTTDSNTPDTKRLRGYGDVLKCSSANTGNMTCSSLNIRQVNANGKSLCAQLRKDPNRSHCEEDQRLGATIAVNRNFHDIMYTTSTVPMVTVCAPGWKNPYNEFKEKTYQKFMIGVCLKLEEDLNVMDCRASDSTGYCWPFWPQGDTAFYKGRPVYSYAESGFAADFTKDGLQEVISAPGIEDWRGGYRSHRANFEKVVKRTDHPTTQYYGYSLVTGQFKVQNCNILAGVPNFYDADNGNLGKIEVLRDADKMEIITFGKKRSCKPFKLADMSSINGEQVGSKFGAAVAAIDITGDNYDEVFVGAPLYSGDQPEEGRVFVYTTTKKALCGPIGILSGSALIKGSRSDANYARFGTAINSAGDLDNDGYKDVAVGAPYEDAGRGAIYIYHGIGQCNCLMEDKFSQRILGRDLDMRLRAFGWHIYGEDDIDHNQYPDLAVGAYASDQAVVLRTRPIVSVSAEMKINPERIPLNGSSLECSRDKWRLCVEVTVLFLVSGKGIPDNLTLEFELKADTEYERKEGESRLVFRDTDVSQNVTTLSITNNRFEKNYTFDVKNRSTTAEPTDVWTPIRIEGIFELLKSSDSDFNTLDPVLKEGDNHHIKSDVEFAINCDDLADCESNLKLTVQLYLLSAGKSKEVAKDTIIYVDASNEMQMKVDVTNLLLSSYGSTFTSSASAALIRDVTLSDSRQGAVDATCNQATEITSSSLNCSAISKLDLNQNFKVKAGFDISRARLMPEDKIENLQRFIEINVTADQVNLDVNRANNNFSIKLPVMLKYNIEITYDKEISDQIRYSADEQSTRIWTIYHVYYVTNDGPSMVPKTYVNITVPLAMQEIVYAKLKGVSEGCTIEGSEAQIQTTTETLTSTEAPTKGYTLLTPKPQRRKRELPQKETSGNDTKMPAQDVPVEESAKSVLNITCLDGRFECVKIYCLVKNLVKHDQKIINITIDINENSLAKAKSKREIRYGTRAVVTDPHVWFGGKVVPWDKTPFGEKYTTFVVEPATVVNEINIWIIIGSIVGAILLLIIVVVILWKVGFFKRKKHNKVKKWRQESLYKRRSRISSTKSQSQYNPMESKSQPQHNPTESHSQAHPTETSQYQYNPMET